MNDIDFKQKVKGSEIFSNFPLFKQTITLKNKNINRLNDLYQQARKFGIEYLEQNHNLMSSDVALISNIIENENIQR
jgi:hypothetical protein